MKKSLFITVILFCFSCKVTKNVTPVIPDLEIDNFKGNVKSITLNTYTSTETSPNTTFSKSDTEKLNKIIYKGGFLGNELTLNKTPNYEVKYNTNGKIIYLKLFNLKDSIVNTNNITYTENKIIANKITNKIGISTSTSNSFKNGKTTIKTGKSISEKKNIFFNTKRIYSFNNNKLNTTVFLKDKDTISITKNQYFSDGKLKSINIESDKKDLSEVTNIEYLKKDNLSIKITKVNNKTSQSKSTETFDENNFILKTEANILFKKKRINGKSVTEYFYQGKEKNKKLLKTIKTESFSNLQISKTVTSYFPNGLEKSIEKEHIRKGTSKIKFEYNFDAKNNWTHKYFFDENKKGFTKVQIREIEYY